jgi:hypothetical protein
MTFIEPSLNPGFIPPNPPTIQGFLTFIQNIMGVPASYLPVTTPWITYAFNRALAIVNADLGVIPSIQGTWSVYSQAVYNLAGALLIEFVPDVSYGIGALVWSAGLVTITTDTTNGVLVGDPMVVTGVSPNGYNGPIVVNSVLSTTQFQYPLKTNYGTATVQQTVPNPVYTDRVTQDDQVRITTDDENRIILPIDYQPFIILSATVTETFWANARSNYKMTSFTPGVVTSSSDVSTSVGLLNPQFLQNLTLGDLQLLKTPYGQAYLALAQKYGPNIWGIS